MPIPQGFTVTTEACTDYYKSGKKITDEIQAQIFEALSWLEQVNDKKFGDTSNPLLVSVRSGARASMPGMMDTILNLGLNDESVKGFALKTGNERFAYDSYRRFIQMFSDVVMEVPKSFFESIIDDVKAEKGVKYDTELTAEDMKNLVEKFKKVYKDNMNGEDFPQDFSIPYYYNNFIKSFIFLRYSFCRPYIVCRNCCSTYYKTYVKDSKADCCNTGVFFMRLSILYVL